MLQRHERTDFFRFLKWFLNQKPAYERTQVPAGERRRAAGLGARRTKATLRRRRRNKIARISRRKNRP
jgi:hypothetical protein